MAATIKNYTIPLRKRFQRAAPRRRGPRAVKAVKDYLRQHCKTDEVKVGAHLNDALWERGITNPPAKVTVAVVVEDGVAKAELEGFAYEEAKKIQQKEEPQSVKDKLASTIGAKQHKEEERPAAKEEQPAAQREQKSPTP
ncbi:60S ribosomal protein L31 [Candidatus Woesearchaeota archaeon]|nr:60S ribosomal protein L31 [Candidatus Woesearchaeota archaeon]